MDMMTITSVPPDEFSKDVDRYISETNTLHKAFEIPGVDEKSVAGQFVAQFVALRLGEIGSPFSNRSAPAPLVLSLAGGTPPVHGRKAGSVAAVGAEAG